MTGAEYSILYSSSPDKAYKALFDEYCGYVYAIVYNKLRSCGTAEDVEECVSDVFAEMYLKYNSGSQYPGDLRGYIGTAAKRRAINRYHRLSAMKNKTVSADEDSSTVLRSETDMEEESDKAELRMILLSGIRELGEPDSTIIIQKYYFGRTFGDIAKGLSMNAPAVKMRCGRALKRLRKKLEAKGIGGSYEY